MENKNINITDEILVMYITKSSEKNINKTVEEWLLQSEENRIYFENLKKVWEKSADVNHFYNFDTEIALKKVKSRLDIENLTNPKSKFRKLIPYIAVAASVVLIIGFYFIISNKSDNKKQNIELLTFITTTEKSEITLPDGTIVYLNVNSEISYPKDFNGDLRKVNFKGEAYFVVEHDVNKPFVIITQQSSVKVVGTEFNLRAKPDENVESIIVSDGKVIYAEVENENNNVELTVGDKATINKSDNKIIEEVNTDENFLAWKTGILTFKDKSVSDVIKTLSGFYNVSFKFEDIETENLRISSKYDNLSIDEVINTIELTLNVEIEKQDTLFLIKAK